MRITIPFFSILFFISSFAFAQQESVWERYPDYIRDKNSFKRLEWFYRQRSAPDDFIDIKKFNEEKAELIAKLNTDSRSTQLEWEPIGPVGINAGWPAHWGRVSGRTKAIAIHPTNPDIVYIGASAGGIWKTTNGGENWEFAGDEFTNNSFGAITIDPNNPDVIYAGTGESLLGYNATTYTGDGIYKSTDAGDTWVKIGAPGEKTHITDILVHPADSDLIFATLASGYWHYGSPGTEGVWKSTDGGSTWSRAIPGINNTAFDLAIHPENSDILYAGVGGSNSNNGFYKSTDRGVSWSRAGNGVPISILNKMHFDVAQTAPNTVYMIVYSSNGTGTTVYKSTDSGDNFTQLSASHNFGGNYGGGWRDQGWYDLMIAVSPGDENLVFTGNLELHKTSDGSNFSVIRMPGGSGAWDSPMHVDYHKIVFSPSNPDIVFVGCDGGVYKSTDAGRNWFSVNNGISTIQFYRLSSSPFNENLMIGGAQDNGIFLRTTGGNESWDFVGTGDGMESVWDYNNPNIAYSSTQNGAIYKTTNGGASISTISPNYSDTPTWTVPIVMHPTDSRILYTASRFVWRTTNGGNNWTAITGQVTSDAINTMAQSSVNPNNMILAGSGSFNANPSVHVSTDAGFTWTDVTTRIPGSRKYISRVYAHPTEEKTIFVVRSGIGSGKLYRSEDMGTTWVDVSGNLPDVPHNDFMIDPGNPKVYLILNDFGVYMSIDKGENWVYESNGMPVVPAMDFSYYTDGVRRIARVGTHGRSAFQAELNNVSVPVELTSFSAEVIHGNVILNWKTATETNNMGFEVERGKDTDTFKRIAFVDGNGTSTSPNSYIYTDKSAPATSYYRLKQIDFDGSYEYSGVVKVENNIPLEFSVNQNYPNPFNPSTRIIYSVPDEGTASIFITNPIGEIVENIFSGTIDAGSHEFMWNASGLPTGIYFYTVEYHSGVSGKTAVDTKKMIYLK